MAEKAKDNVKKTGKTGYHVEYEGTIKSHRLPRFSDLKKVSEVKKGKK